MADRDSKLEQALSDRYILDRELGRGGMATVYLARDVEARSLRGGPRFEWLGGSGPP